MHRLDALEGWHAVARATERAAERLLALGGSIGEVSDQQPAMRAALSEIEGWQVDLSESTLPLIGWCHEPGGIDVKARDSAGERWIGELKLRETDQCLWDLLKVADGMRLSDIAFGFLLVGSRDQDATRPERCRELLIPGRTRHQTLNLFNENGEAWTYLLQGGTARPLEIPSAVITELRTDPEINLDGKPSRMQLVSVEADWSQTISMDQEWWCGEWPPGIHPTQRWAAWRLRHAAFLRGLGSRGSSSWDEAEALARALGLNLNKDTALRHSCKPLITRKPLVSVTDAGRSFVGRWEGPLGDYRND